MNRIVKQKDETGTSDLLCRLTGPRHRARDGERAREEEETEMGYIREPDWHSLCE